MQTCPHCGKSLEIPQEEKSVVKGEPFLVGATIQDNQVLIIPTAYKEMLITQGYSDATPRVFLPADLCEYYSIFPFGHIDLFIISPWNEWKGEKVSFVHKGANRLFEFLRSRLHKEGPFKLSRKVEY